MRRHHHNSGSGCGDCHDHGHHGCHHRPIVVDYVVVGAGTAGAPLAKLLSDDPDVSVLVLESGINRNNDPLTISGNPFPQFLVPDRHLYYPYDLPPLQPSFLNTPPPFGQALYPEGKLWGGSHGHNFLAVARGTPCNWDRWACAGGKAWSYCALLPLFKWMETYTPEFTGVFNEAERGRCGPLSVTQWGGFGPIDPNDPIVQALAANGQPYSPDFNDPSRGVFVTADDQQSITAGAHQRSFTGNEFLGPDVVDPDTGLGVCGRDLTILSGARALRLLFDDEVDFNDWRDDAQPFVKDVFGEEHLTVRGVEYIDAEGNTRTVLARKKVILSAGAVQSPAILQRSGIGPADVLAQLGICPRLINENVGGDLQEHYGPIVVLPIPDPAATPKTFSTFFAGPRSEPDGCRFAVGIIAVNDPSFDPRFGGALGAINFLFDIEERGRVIARSTTNPDDIFIDFDFYASERDRQDAVLLLKAYARISISLTGLLPIAPPPAAYPEAEFGAQGGLAQNDQALIDYAIQSSQIAYHVSGTARMSQCEHDGVVDENLDVHGVRNLGIADNSVAPRINDGGTSYTALVAGIKKAAIEGAPVDFSVCDTGCGTNTSFNARCDDHDCGHDDHGCDDGCGRGRSGRGHH